MYFQDKIVLLISQAEIETVVRRLAAEIRRDYLDKNPILIGILKGSFIFLSDLIRFLDIPLEVEFIRLSSYGQNDRTYGEVKLVQGLNCSVKNRHIIIVEDIIDTGFTLNYLCDYLKNMEPSSLKTCSFADKPSRRLTKVDIDYIGITVPDKFIVGYGLDWHEKYRNLPGLYIMEDPDN